MYLPFFEEFHYLEVENLNLWFYSIMESVIYDTVKMKVARICIIYFSMPTPPTSPTRLHMTKHSRITTYRSQSGKVKRDIFLLQIIYFYFFSEHVEGDHWVCAECQLRGRGGRDVGLTLTRGEEEPETEIRSGKSRHVGGPSKGGNICKNHARDGEVVIVLGPLYLNI